MASESTAAAARFGAPVKAARAAAKGAVERLAAVELYRDLASAEPAWRALERNGVLSPYQHFDWIAAWQRHDGAAQGIKPHIVVGYGRQREPLFLWPLGISSLAGCRVGRFLGGKHANFNFGPWRRGIAFGADEFHFALQRLQTLAPALDALELLSQPETWEDMANPWRALPHQPSPSFGFGLRLSGSGAELLTRVYSSEARAKLRNKERRLQSIPGFRYARAATAAEVDRYLEAFWVQKAERFAAQGIDDVFARPEVRAFLREACLQGLETGTPVIEIHALDSDAGVLAIWAGVTDGRRFSAMLNSINRNEYVKYSPGQVLLSRLIVDCADRGFQIFDLGTGEAQYKDRICNKTEPLFDSFVPLSLRGRLFAPALSLKASAKRTIKRSPMLWRLVQKLRRVL